MRRLIALPFALVAVLAVGATVLAGGWATVDAAGPTNGAGAGTGTTLNLEVRQHGVTPVSWPRISVIATNKATGEKFTSTATPTAEQTGHYTATLTFPTEGSWTLSYESPDLVMEGTATLAVAAPVVAAAAAANAAPAASTGGLDPAIIGSIGAVVLLLLVIVAAAAIYQRRPERRKQPTAVGG